jgi:type VI secretion system protein VasD
VVELSLSAAPDINPSRDGRPSPVVVHVYQLQSLTTFNEADFFQLTDQAAATLGSALVAQEELVLTPGETKTIVREFKPEARFLGVLVSYRDIDHAVWRASAEVLSNQKSALEVRLISLTVALFQWES